MNPNQYFKMKKQRENRKDTVRLKKNIKQGIRVFDAILILFFLAIAVLAIYNKVYLEEFVLQELQNSGLVTLGFINFILELIPQLVAPVAMVFSALALGFNPHLVIIVGITGSFLGSIAGYQVGKKYGFNVLNYLFEDVQIQKAVDFMNKYGKIAVFLAAISPLPYVPMIIGALDMNRKNFTLFGLLPRALGLIIAGYSFYFLTLI